MAAFRLFTLHCSWVGVQHVKDSLVHDEKAVTAIDQIIDAAVSRLFNDLLSQSVHFSRRGDTLGIWLKRCYGHFHRKETLRPAPYGIASHILFLSENWLSFLNEIAGPASQTGTKRSWGWRLYIKGQLKLHVFHYHLKTHPLQSHQTMKLSSLHTPQEAGILQ